MRQTRQLAAQLLGSDTDVPLDAKLTESQSAELFRSLLETIQDTLTQGHSLEMPDGFHGPLTPEAVGVDFRDINEPRVCDMGGCAVRAAVRALVASRLDVPFDELGPELSFALDLGADSLTRVDLVLLLEEVLEVSVPDESMPLIQTVGDAELYSRIFDGMRDAPDGEHLASGSIFLGPLPKESCATLDDATRLAFLWAKVRGLLAGEGGPEEVSLSDSLGRLGIDGQVLAKKLHAMAQSMDFALPDDGSSWHLAQDPAVALWRASAQG